MRPNLPFVADKGLVIESPAKHPRVARVGIAQEGFFFLLSFWVGALSVYGSMARFMPLRVLEE